MEAIISLPYAQQFSACYDVLLRTSLEALQPKTFYCLSFRTVKSIMSLIKMVENSKFTALECLYSSHPFQLDFL
jgi:hypothetical protein